MIKGVYRLTEEWARKSQHKYTLKLHNELGAFMGDERRLKQVLLNLIRNAIAFTPRGGQIEVGAAREENYVLIWVKDDGLGIPQEEQDRIFKAFERLTTEDIEMSRRAGAGLGLSLVQSIVHLHGGRIELESEPGDGTLITIILPVEAL